MTPSEYDSMLLWMILCLDLVIVVLVLGIYWIKNWPKY